jgi:UDP-GlcNAc:undecaprenyl-phosphate GlcNAc-1-phosphate transferase
MHPTLIAFLTSALLALALTPAARRLAWAIGFLDRPTTALKTQRQPVAYLGGLAVATAFGLSLLWVKFRFAPSAGFEPWPGGLERGRGVYAIGLGGCIALLLGLLDDKHALSPQLKFLGQLVGALVLVACGLRVRFIHNEALSMALTVLWVLTLTNALNFVDIMDGLAASVGLAASLAFLAFALHGERLDDGLAAAALAGACVGFLPYNWRPASIYLGDAGSHFMGFSLAAISLNLRYSHQNELAVFSPLVILALPLFDLALMIVVRTRKGIPPWKGSPDHVPLRLKHLGLGVPRVVLLLAGATAGMGALVYAASFLSLRQALLLWALLGAAAVFLAAWLMAIEMPHDIPPPTPSRPAKKTAGTSGQAFVARKRPPNSRTKKKRA